MSEFDRLNFAAGFDLSEGLMARIVCDEGGFVVLIVPDDGGFVVLIVVDEGGFGILIVDEDGGFGSRSDVGDASFLTGNKESLSGGKITSDAAGIGKGHHLTVEVHFLSAELHRLTVER